MKVHTAKHLQHKHKASDCCYWISSCTSVMDRECLVALHITIKYRVVARRPKLVLVTALDKWLTHVQHLHFSEIEYSL